MGVKVSVILLCFVFEATTGKGSTGATVQVQLGVWILLHQALLNSYICPLSSLKLIFADTFSKKVSQKAGLTLFNADNINNRTIKDVRAFFVPGGENTFQNKTHA